jgi:DNA-binding NarL/FixJ family response regulator
MTANTLAQARPDLVADPDALPSDRLTGHELEVALLMARGATIREAAESLLVSPKTIEAYLGRIYRKLGIRSPAELARILADPDKREKCGFSNARPAAVPSELTRANS